MAKTTKEKRRYIAPAEHERRLAIYNQGAEEKLTVAEMAERAGMGKSGFASWMYCNNLLSHPKKPMKPEHKARAMNNLVPFKTHDPYVHTRPAWELDRVKHFASKLLDSYNKGNGKVKPNIKKFLDTYQSIYGTN